MACGNFLNQAVSDSSKRTILPDGTVNGKILISYFRIAVDMISFVTVADGGYERFWLSLSDRNTLVFSVKSCGHLKLALSSLMYNIRVQVW